MAPHAKEWTEQEISKHGLNPRDLVIHRRRIQDSLSKKTSSFIKILDSFRLDNGGILPARYYSAAEDRPDGFIAFVPAAGAGSRYFQPLQALRQALVDGDQAAILSEVEKLRAEGASQWPLPKALNELLMADNLPSKAILDEALEEIALPKALLPYRKDAKSYLQKKMEEHSSMPALLAEVYVAPLGGSESFAQHLNATQSDERLQFLEQGPELSTLRFNLQGEPFRDPDGEISLVPAGHGMLVRLFAEIAKKFPTGHSLFIRNIDNVIDEVQPSLDDIESFLQQHQVVLEGLRSIRSHLKKSDLEAAAKTASQMRSRFLSNSQSLPLWVQDLGPFEKALWTLQFQIFHCPYNLAESLRIRLGDTKALMQLYSRPFNSLGQVPNNGKDVGGSPVRASHDGDEVAICLELPHASVDDRKAFLEDPKVATHFNPVFVAAEIPEDQSVYDLEQCPFWILAEKNIQGTPVVYHEIVLYEVLGNSFTANVIFPEIPRRLFNPHKSLLDGVKKA